MEDARLRRASTHVEQNQRWEKKKGWMNILCASEIVLCASGKRLNVFIQGGLGGRALARASIARHPALREYLGEKEKVEDDPGGSCATRGGGSSCRVHFADDCNFCDSVLDETLVFALAGFGIGRNKPPHVDQHIGGHSLMGVKCGIREKADRSTENIYIENSL